jgi:hypothetical protein
MKRLSLGGKHTDGKSIQDCVVHGSFDNGVANFFEATREVLGIENKRKRDHFGN